MREQTFFWRVLYLMFCFCVLHENSETKNKNHPRSLSCSQLLFYSTRTWQSFKHKLSPSGTQVLYFDVMFTYVPYNDPYCFNNWAYCPRMFYEWPNSHMWEVSSQLIYKYRRAHNLSLTWCHVHVVKKENWEQDRSVRVFFCHFVADYCFPATANISFNVPPARRQLYSLSSTWVSGRNQI